MSEREMELLQKFQKIINISQEVSQAQIAKYLNISEGELFEYIVEWSNTIPFKIKRDMIIVEDVTDFMRALDKQYDCRTRSELIRLDTTDTQEELTTFEQLFGLAYPVAGEAHEQGSAMLPSPIPQPSKPVSVSKAVEQKPRTGSPKADSATPPVVLAIPVPEGAPSWVAQPLSDFSLKTKPDDVVIELDGQKLTAFPKSLFTTHLQVEELYLAKNSISQIPTQINQLKNLRILDLTENQLPQVPIALSECRKLKELNLTSNRLQNLPAWISKLTELKFIYLDKNQLDELPTSILELPRLKELHIEYNRFEPISETQAQLIAALEKKGVWVKRGIQLKAQTATTQSITQAAVLKCFASPDWIPITTIIQKMNVPDLAAAKLIQALLHELVDQKKLEATVKSGKRMWKKV